MTTRPCEDCHRPFTAGPYARWGECCRWKHRGKRRMYVWTPERDALLRERYDGRRGTCKRLAAALAWPRWVIQRRVAELALTKRAENRRAWTPEEIAFLDDHAGERVVGWIARKLGRSKASVALRMKRTAISQRVTSGYTLRDLELCFGVDHHAIGRWIRTEQLQGERRHGGAGPAFPLDAWHFSDADVMRFIRENPTAFQLSRVDQTWFLDLVLGGERARWRVA